MGHRLGWLLLLAATTAGADQWTFFYPELVESFSCTVSRVEMIEHGGQGRDVWQALASARRDPKAGQWEMTVGLFPPTVKGRHGAEKACSKWMDEASQRVRAARR